MVRTSSAVRTAVRRALRLSMLFFGRLPEIAENAIGNACAGFSPRQPDREKMEKLLKGCCYDTEADF